MLVARHQGTEQNARDLDLLERRQRRVALERLRERRGARVSDMVIPQAAAKHYGQGCSHRPPAQSRARATYSSDVNAALLLSASESAAAPAAPIWLLCKLQRGEEGQGCSWRDKSRARATY
jgi:hypothetical protein